MKNELLVTCIILTYQKFEYFYQALDSLLAQDYPNIELIITDDGSKYFPKEEISKYISINSQKNISNLIINQNPTNLGIVKNLNTALKLSNGKYIILLAGDDLYYEQTTVSKVVNFFKNNNYIIATGYRDIYTEDMTKLISREPKDIRIFNTDSKKIYEKLCLGNFISGSCTYFSREFIEKYGYFDEKYLLLEDYPKYLSITRQGCMIGFFGFPIIKYRSGGISTQHIMGTNLKNDFKLVYENEILNYKSLLNIFLYRRAKLYYILHFNRLSKSKIYLSKFLYLDVIIYYRVKNYFPQIINFLF